MKKYSIIGLLNLVYSNFVYGLSIVFNLVLRFFYSLNTIKKDLNTEKMIQELDAMEKIAVFFGNGANNQPYQNTLEKINLMPIDSTEIIRRIIGLKYRLRSENGGVDPIRISADQMDVLLEKAAIWSQSQKLFHSYSKIELREILHEAANYREFIALLLDDSSLQDAFFAWVIRDRIAASIFIEYPALQKRIVASNLHIRVGHFKRSGLNIRHVHVTHTTKKKIVTLLIEGRDVNILDEKKTVALRGHWTLTIDEIFQIFQLKTHFAGNLEYMEGGIVNWNVYEWGYWDDEKKKLVAFDFEQKDWWHQLPKFRRISQEEASRELGHALNGKNWGISARATRKYTNMNLFENHAYVEVFFPNRDGLGYSTLPLGKYAKSVPSTALEAVSMLCSMAPATISFIDENIFYTFREHAQYGFVMTPEEGEKFTEIVREDFTSGKAGHLVYQIETENCAKWVQETLVSVLGEERVPNLYKTFFLETEAEGGLGWMMQFLRLFPKKWQPWLVTRFHIPLGAFKGSWIERQGMRHWLSLMTHPFWQDGVIYFPAFLHLQIQRGSLLVRKVINFTKVLFQKFLYTILGLSNSTGDLSKSDIKYVTDKVGHRVLKNRQILQQQMKQSLSHVHHSSSIKGIKGRKILYSFVLILLLSELV